MLHKHLALTYGIVHYIAHSVASWILKTDPSIFVQCWFSVGQFVLVCRCKFCVLCMHDGSRHAKCDVARINSSMIPSHPVTFACPVIGEYTDFEGIYEYHWL